MADYQPHRRRPSADELPARQAPAARRTPRNTGSRAKAHRAQTNAQRYGGSTNTGRASSRAQTYSYSITDILANKTVRIALCVLLALVAIGLLDLAVNWGRIYPGVRIGTVDVSGMTFSEAYDAVQLEYDARLGRENITICADEETQQRVLRGEQIENYSEYEDISYEEALAMQRAWPATASSLQARLDTTGMVSAALEVGREDGGILGRMSAQTVGCDIDPILNFNEQALETLTNEINMAVGSPHVDYGVAMDYGTAYVTEGYEGEEVDPNWLAGELRNLMLNGEGNDTLLVQVSHAGTKIGRAEAQAAVDKINAAIACGATFSFNGTFWNASTYELGDLIATRTVQDGNKLKLEPYYDESATTNAILTNLQSNFMDQDIQVEFVKSDDTVMVRTNATGTMPETAKAVQALTQATLETTPSDTPMIEVEGTQMPSAMSIQAAMDYGIITVISSYETEYTGGASARNNNIHLAADLLDNSIIKANGGEWSFNETAGECDESKGFKGAGSIVNGESVDEIGGGICQVATTVFNAVFEAGLPIDERSNHSLYIASYPEGRDAAISYPDPDLRWHNDTPNDILLQMEWTDTTVTATLLGVNPGYVVESETGEMKRGAKYGKRTVVDESLPDGATEIKQYGEDGATVTVTRTVKDAKGEILHVDTFESVYDAKDEIILTGPSGTTQESDESSESA